MHRVPFLLALLAASLLTSCAGHGDLTPAQRQDIEEHKRMWKEGKNFKDLDAYYDTPTAVRRKGDTLEFEAVVESLAGKEMVPGLSLLSPVRAPRWQHWHLRSIPMTKGAMAQWDYRYFRPDDFTDRWLHATALGDSTELRRGDVVRVKARMLPPQIVPQHWRYFDWPPVMQDIKVLSIEHLEKVQADYTPRLPFTRFKQRKNEKGEWETAADSVFDRTGESIRQ